MTFLEPMVTRDFLLGKTCVQKDIPVPEVYPKSGLYPQSYAVDFDEVQNLYFIRLKGMKLYEPAAVLKNNRR